MTSALPIWHNRSVAVFGLVFWNRDVVRALLEQNGAAPSFHGEFEQALEAARSAQGVLLAWSSRLTDAQEQACEQAQVPLIHMEDGFIRSVGLGAAMTPAASLIFDSRGIYYDPSRASDLEYLLEHRDLGVPECERGTALRAQICQLGVSKYNLGQTASSRVFPSDRRAILVPGQVSDDAAILKTRSDSLDLSSGENPNLLLLQRVRADNPDAYILFKPHPDVSSGLRKGGLTIKQVLSYADAMAPDIDIISLIDQCDQLETISSLSGFEALLRGKEVVVHGQPFYAGWGLTKDHTSFARRTRKRSLAELVYLTLVEYSIYLHPLSHAQCEVEQVIEALSEMRKADRHRWRRKVKLAFAWIGERLGL